MNLIIKLAIASVIIGGFITLVKNSKDKFSSLTKIISFKIVSFGTPTLQGKFFTVPLGIQINNASPLDIPVDTMSVKIFMLRNSMWIPVGNIDPSGAFVVKQGQTPLTLQPHIDLVKVNPFGSGNLFQKLNTVLSSKNPVTQLKAIVSITLHGITFEQEQLKSIYLNQLLHAA